MMFFRLHRVSFRAGLIMCRRFISLNVARTMNTLNKILWILKTKNEALIWGLKHLWRDMKGLPLMGRLLLYAAALFLVIILVANLSENIIGTHARLADSFLHGKLYLRQPADKDVAVIDTTLWEGKLYWPGGPVPALLCLPFVAVLGSMFEQGFLKFLLNILNLLLLLNLSHKLGIKNRSTSLFLALGFITATAYSMVAMIPISVYLPQIAATTFFLMAILEYLGRRRWWWIGILAALAFGSRTNLILGLVPFLLFVATEDKTFRSKATALIQLMIPVFMGVVLLFIYNYYRFGNIWETGYNLQTWINPKLSIVRDTWGLFNFRYLPANIYYFLLKGPELVFSDDLYVHAKFPFIKASPWGMSIILTSPMFLLSLKNKLTRQVKIVWLGVMIILLSDLLYYGIGRLQYGYRYALDVYPLLYVLTANAVSKNEKRPEGLLRSFVFFGLMGGIWLGLPLYIKVITA
jgi:hypothetical protein